MALIDKTAAKTAVGLQKVLDKVKSEFGNPTLLNSLPSTKALVDLHRGGGLRAR